MENQRRSSRKRSSRSYEEQEEEETPSKRQEVEEEEEENHEEVVATEETAPDDEDGEEEQEDDRGEEEEDEEVQDDDEDAEEEASSPRGPRRSINPPGRAPEAGIIQQVRVEDFMCHKKFTVDLCRNVNFITGQNGSGKSAVLAAIQICLGAGARRTHRARNLKDLIRKDVATNAPTRAKIRVTLLNKGSDAFEPDVYGETITVERTISMNGGFNGYKLYGHDGNEKSRSKKDLDALLDKLNIQVENPVAVLDQEEAKKFLLGKSEDKYSFFMRATELSRIDNTHNSTAEKIDEMADAHEKLAAGLERKKKQCNELKRKCEEHKLLGKMTLKLLQHQASLAWAIHQGHDEYCAGHMEQIAKYEEKLEKQKEKVAEAEKAASDPDAEAAAAQNKVDELVKEGGIQKELKAQLENELREMYLPQKKLERELKDLQNKSRTAERNLQRAKNELEQARNEMLRKTGESRQAQLLEQLKQCEAKMEEYNGQTNELRQSMSEHLRLYEEVEPHLQDAKNRVQNIRRQLGGVANTIQSLKTTKDSLAMFGPRVKAMHQKVEEAKRNGVFKGPVLGPIGHYVKVRSGKEMYAAVAEYAMGRGTLDRFIVTNDHDRQAVQRIRKQVRCQTDCGTYQICESPRFQIPPPPVEGVETIATVLQIDNDLVFNCLVDNARIDIVAICRDTPTSERQLLCRNQNGEDAIRGRIKNVYCLPDGDTWTVNNGSRAMFTNQRKLRKTIGVDTRVALQEAKAEEDQLKKELHHLGSEESRLEHEHTKHQRDWNAAKGALRKNTDQIETMENKIEAIRGEIETSENVTVDTMEFEQDVDNYEQEKESLEEQKEQLEKEIEAMQPAIEAKIAEVTECSARNDRVIEEMQVAEQNLTQQLDTKTQLESQLEKKRSRLEKISAAIDTAREKAQDLEKDRDKALLNARRLTFRYQTTKKIGDENVDSADLPSQEPTDEELDAIEPVQVEKDQSYYEAKIMSMTEKIDKEKQKRAIANEDPVHAQEKYSRAYESYKNDKKCVIDIAEKMDILEEDLKARHERWTDMRKALQSITKMKFKELLTLNKYSGKITFDERAKTLDLLVSKDKGKGSRNKDVKSLSGGERSYTTMCLLLALGESLETPFRILDEFDVFLDGPSRRLAIQMLIHLAQKKMGHRQFIFITPQDLHNIQTGPELKVLRIRNPERSERVGGPSQQTLDFASQG